MRNKVSILLVFFCTYDIGFWKSREWLSKPPESLTFKFCGRKVYKKFQIILTLLHRAAAVYDFTPI